ncbi:MAG: SAM-dependent methyltransferase [Alphaproteobacteria bacterium]|nr:SAM-dependent methyltransferase [Alphaproteobacteria bacterium]
MANERKTENIVRNMLSSAGYDSKDIIIEEQTSENPSISKLLKNSSKKGVGAGRPEFIIHSSKKPNFLIVIECKADEKKHESDDRNKYAEYAVDGVLLYASFLAKEYDVLAIAVSGESKSKLKISHFIHPKEANSCGEYFKNTGKLLQFDDYVSGFETSDIKFNEDYAGLLEYTKKLNDDLHERKIKESQRSLLISGILIALQNEAFKKSYQSHQKAEQIAKKLVDAIIEQFDNASIPEERIKRLRQGLNFILSHPTLTSDSPEDKDFFVNLISEINKNVNGFMKTHKYFDTLGQFYIEFLRYANNDKGLGIVLTPPHITELFCEMAGVDKNSVVFDNCCGTGGFLISAMKAMIKDADGDKQKEKRIKEKQIIGIEFQDDIYALCASNMVIHGDGKTNIIPGDCFKKSEDVGKKFKPTIGLLNPPYKSKKTDIEEFEFILNNLSQLQPGGTCIAIVPLSCAIAVDGKAYDCKKRLLMNHTLEAVMSMPSELFHNSKVNVVTCAIVVTAHQPHPSNKKTWLGYWRDDGFVKQKGKGRIDKNHRWKSIKAEWLALYANKETKTGSSITTRLMAKDEWCAEAYMETDYSNLTRDVFEKEVKKFTLFNLMLDLNEGLAEGEGNEA